MAQESSVNPPGFAKTRYQLPLEVSQEWLSAGAGQSSSTDSATVAKLQQRAMSMATGQVGGIFQSAFMMWMIGSQIQLFTLFMLAHMGTTPIKNLFNTNKMFASVEAPGVSLLLPKALYFLINAAGAGLFLFKLKGMGLLPLTSADWVSLLPIRQPIEHSGLAGPL